MCVLSKVRMMLKISILQVNTLTSGKSVSTKRAQVGNKKSWLNCVGKYFNIINCLHTVSGSARGAPYNDNFRKISVRRTI